MKAFNKDIVRSIRHSLGRFIALMAIVALGTGFYAGLRMTGPDMNLAADTYYDGTNLMDIRVVSTMGLTQSDVDALKQVEGVEGVMPAYTTDVLGILNDNQYVIRVHSLSLSASYGTQIDDSTIVSSDVNYLNRLELVEGRWPEAANECVIFNDRVMSGPSDIGDVITVDPTVGSVDGTLAVTEFTIVGRVHSPLYVSSTSMGTSTIGSGTVQQFMYVLPSAFDPDLPFVEAYVTVAGAKDLSAQSSEYDDLVQSVVDRIEALAPEREQARYEALQADAQTQVDEARDSYESEKKSTLADLSAAKEKLDSSAAEIETGKTELADALSTLEASEKQLTEGEAAYNEGVTSLETERAAAEAQFEEAQAKLDTSKASVEAAQAKRPEVAAALQQVNASLQNTALSSAQKEELEAQAAQLQQQLNAIDQAQSEYDAGVAELAQKRAAADAQFKEAEEKLAATRAQLDEAKTQLEQGRADYATAKEKLEAGEKEYDSGKATYEEGEQEAQEAFTEAEEELDDAQQKVNDIERPEWLIMDRSKNYGVVSFESDAERIDAIAAVFPFIFFLVAALVALTTMTRMVEEERLLIGTYKALGYSRARIISKYVIYAALAAGLGSVIGIAVLSQVLPWVIMKAYAIVYYVPQIALPLHVGIALLAAGLGIGVTLLATVWAAAASLRATPASLMQPPAPKAGKRILLERITPVWKHLSFSWKVTFRNIFRYKRRLVMTCVGIAGCTALLLTGLGLQNSINDIIDVQYGEIVSYNVVISEKSDATEERLSVADEILDDTARLPVAVRATKVSLVALESDGTEVLTTVVAPADPAAFESLWKMRTRTDHANVNLTNDGVVLSEKLAKKLDVGVGDTATFAEQDDLGNATSVHYQLPVVGIVENYIGDYAFMTQEAYESFFGKAADNLTVFAQVSTSEQEQTALSEALRATGAVDTVAYNQETIDAYKQMLQSVNMVVVVLVVAAAALAFVVLYNLTNINITERAREIATLKVLGFTSREVDAYIFREIMLLTILGALFGLGLGIVLEGFVVVTAEVNQVMFGRTIHALSFVVAFVVTLVFTVVVMLAMKPKLAHIDMVESLKSNE